MSKPSRRGPRRAGTPTSRSVGAAPAGVGAPPAGTGGSGAVPGRPPGGRVGRRERARTGYARRSFLERYRGPLIALAAVAILGVVGAFAFQSITRASYVCSTEWAPAATPSPDPSGSGRLGLVQPDMGRDHNVAAPQPYTYCPPASGDHFNLRGQGPIEARLYGPDDAAGPPNWVHNLEHGGLVFLYRCREGDAGCDDATQEQLSDLVENFPNSPICDFPPGQIGPVVARFDEMAWPYAALVWGRVLPMEELDPELVYRFFELEGERTNPEKFCEAPSPSPGVDASGSPAASGASPAVSASPADASASPAASGSPAAGGSPAGGSAAPSASPAASPASS